MDRENKGRQYTGDLLKRALSLATTGTDDLAGPSTREPTTYSDSDSDSEGPGLGDIVAIVLSDSTVTKPNIEVGKVIRIDKDKTRLRYLLLSHIGANKYHCKLGAVRKATLEHVVYPVDFNYISQENTYHLLSTPTEIHLSKYPHT